MPFFPSGKAVQRQRQNPSCSEKAKENNHIQPSSPDNSIGSIGVERQPESECFPREIQWRIELKRVLSSSQCYPLIGRSPIPERGTGNSPLKRLAGQIRVSVKTV